MSHHTRTRASCWCASDDGAVDGEAVDGEAEDDGVPQRRYALLTFTTEMTGASAMRGQGAFPAANLVKRRSMDDWNVS